MVRQSPEDTFRLALSTHGTHGGTTFKPTANIEGSKMVSLLQSSVKSDRNINQPRHHVSSSFLSLLPVPVELSAHWRLLAQETRFHGMSYIEGVFCKCNDSWFHREISYNKLVIRARTVRNVKQYFLSSTLNQGSDAHTQQRKKYRCCLLR